MYNLYDDAGSQHHISVDHSSSHGDEENEEEDTVLKKKKRKKRHNDDDLMSNASAIFFDQLADPDIINNILDLESLIPMNFTHCNIRS